MAEPLIAAQGFVVERHPGDDVLELVGTAPGPAGAVELPLGDATLSLDAAEPDVVVGLTAALDNSRGLTPWATAVLDALVGPMVRAGALALPADGRPRRVDVGGAGGGVDRELIVLALVADAGAAPGLLAEERAVAALEVAALARRLDLGRWIDPGGGAARAAAELLAADPGEVGRHPQLAGHTSALLDEYALVAGDAALADRRHRCLAPPACRGGTARVADDG